MNYIERQKQDIFIQAAKFGTDHAETFPAASLAGKLLGDLDGIILNLNSYAAAEVTQSGGKRQHQALKTDARAALVQSLQAISRTARVIALTEPNFDKKFGFAQDATDRELITLARGFADAATPYAEAFVRYALPADFLDRLTTAANEFETSLNERNAVKSAKRGTMNTIDSLIENGNTILKQLDVIVKNVFADNDAKLTEWKRALRPERQRSKPAAKAAKAATPSS